MLRLFIVIFCLLTFGKSFSDNIDHKEFFNKFATDLSSIIDDKSLKTEARKAKFLSFLEQNIAAKEGSKFVVGAAWRDMSKEKRMEFYETYKIYLLNSYYDKVISVSGKEKFQINIISFENGSKDNIMVAKTNIPSTDKAGKRTLYAMDFIISKTQDDCKITDIVFENLSFFQMQRDEFSSIITEKGIDSLISFLKSKSISKK